MSIALITGDHPRHRYFAAQMVTSGLVSLWICERREAFIRPAPSDLDDQLSALFNQHFADRAESERRFFGDTQPDVARVDTTPQTLNDTPTISALKAAAPKLVLSYGCHKLSEGLMRAVGGRFWNTHGGLSPDYKGTVTLFWPSYMLEPQMTGITLHETTPQLDGGGIIHQIAAPMVRGDGIHDIGNRAVKAYADELPGLIAALDMDHLPDGIAQNAHGRLWRDQSWRTEHLRLIYETYDNRMADAVLDGQITGRMPQLKSVLKPDNP